MGKVSIKKNVKPKKITTKKTVKPKKKVIKEKEKTQAISQNVVVNIKDTITKKRRGRATPIKQAQPIKKPTQQSFNPVISTNNQPIFKQPAPQSTLTSSILASQEKTNILDKEKKEQSALTKALTEQNKPTEETKENDLERVRIKKEPEKAQVKPLDKLEELKLYETKVITNALRSQLFDEKGDDTEEINQLITESRSSSLLSPPVNIPNPFKVTTPKIPNPLSKVNVPNVSSSLSTFLNKMVEEEPTVEKLPVEDEVYFDAPEEEYLNQAYAGGVAETKDEEPTDQSQLLRNQQQEQPRQILEPIQPEPTIIQPEPTIIQPEPTITEEPPIKEDKTVIPEPPSILKPVENPPSILQPAETISPIIKVKEIKKKDKTTKTPSEITSQAAEEPPQLVEIKTPDEVSAVSSNYEVIPPDEYLILIGKHGIIKQLGKILIENKVITDGRTYETSADGKRILLGGYQRDLLPLINDIQKANKNDKLKPESITELKNLLSKYKK
jgi:hypothetical protein